MSNRPGWVAWTRDPPSVLVENDIWLVCPEKGFDCARVARDLFGEDWAVDVIAVHVTLHHRTWR